jgi:DME family drug/metabolite transporter
MPSHLLIVAAILLWSTAGVAIKLCSLAPWQIAGGRSLIAAATLWALLPSARRLPRPGSLWIALAYLTTVLAYSLAIKLTTAANAIFLQYTGPLYVLLLGPWILGERAKRSELLTLPFFAVGLLLFFVGDLSPGQSWGNILALISGVGYALLILGLRKSAEEGPAAMVLGNLLAAAIAAPMALQGSLPSVTDWGLLLFLGVFQLGAAYALFARGVRHASALEASLLGYLEPVLNPIWVALFIGELPGRWALIGGAVILAAALSITLMPYLQGRAKPTADIPPAM